MPVITTLCRPATLLAGLLVGGCNLSNAGEPPPEGRTNFPTAIALGPAVDGEQPRHLLVVSSNFDLRYNQGSLQAFDLEDINTQVREVCALVQDADGQCRRPDDCLESPDGILEIEADRVLADEVLIDSFGAGIAVSPPDASGDARVYVPIRSQLHVNVVRYRPDADGDRVLDCGGKGRSCTGSSERGNDSVENDRALSIPGEPVSVLAGRLSDWDPDVQDDTGYLLIGHRRGQVSLFIDGADGEPALTDVLDTFPNGLSGLMFDPQSRLAYGMGNGKQLSRVGVSFRPGQTAHARLYDGGELLLDGLGGSGDTRHGIVLPSDDDAVPSRALLIGRAPSAYMEVSLGPDSRASASTPIERTVEVGSGPSRVAIADLENTAGETLPLAAVACFDGREVFLIDRGTGEPLAVVPNFSGPYELTIDARHKFLYVADFRSSVVRVVDLAPMLPDPGAEPADAACASRTPSIVATLGSPRVVQELQ